MKHFVPILVALLLMTSCVPYKKIVYVQGDLPQKTLEKKAYTIKKNDILYIDMKSADENLQKLFSSISSFNGITPSQMGTNNLYFNGYTVDENGNIDLPLIKKLHVEGQDFEAVKKQIRIKLGKLNIIKPENVFIDIKLAGVPYTVIGEVKNPQKGIIYKNNPTVFDVLGEAGDILLTGNRKQVEIIRIENGKNTKSTLDLTQANVFDSPYFYLRPNDIVYVKPLRQKTLGTGTTLTQTISTVITALSLVTSIILLSKYVK